MAIIKPILLVLLLSFNANCQNGIASKVVEFIDSNCSSDAKCEVILADYTDFEWDEVYLFGEYSDDQFIARTISSNWSGKLVPENHNRFVFLHQRKVVFVEDFDTYAVDIQFRPIDWENDDITHYQKSEAIFVSVEKESVPGSGSFFYDLYPLTGTLKPSSN